MLRSRALREGSVGLMIIGGVALFVGLAFWLRNISLGRTSYRIFVEFEDVSGLKEGTAVNFRGVEVGSVREVKVSDELATARVEINRLDLKIPRDSFVSAQTAALIGDTSLDIDPYVSIPNAEDLAGPLSPDCNNNVILCDESRIRGEKVANVGDLIIAMDKLATILGDAEVLENLKEIAANAVVATRGVTSLTEDLSELTDAAEGEIGTLSTTLKSAQVAANSVNSAANQFGAVATKAGTLADDTTGLVAQASNLADDTSVLVSQAKALIEENRVAIAKTLNDIGQASNQLRATLLTLQPALVKVRDGDIISDFEQLTKNARVLTANLRDASAALSDPQNILLLQQTLDSARVTFTNAQKLTSDLDEITGDPQFRSNVLRLINGLSGLISSTQQLGQQVALGHSLSPQPLIPSQAQRMAKVSQQLNQQSLALAQQLALVAQDLNSSKIDPSEKGRVDLGTSDLDLSGTSESGIGQADEEED